ncbi:MAG TPA: Cof-type HAD-IIB family hydrolase [Virgibacillus sp.]|nr:Cof-type HAD-IIB family hydrolase [Virgibacillus sp.]
MIRLIALDMDGTLLGPDHQVSKKNRDTILAAQASGIQVMVATGRGYQEAFDPVKSVGLDLAYICLNGAEVRETNKQVISSTYINEQDIEQTASVLDTKEIDYQLFIGDRLYTKSVEQQVEIFAQLARDLNQVPPIDIIRAEVMRRVEEGYIHEVASYEELLQTKAKSIYKIFGTSMNRNSLDLARGSLQDLSGLAVSSSGAGNLEITNINAQKGIALDAYTKQHGISMENVMVVGDSFNDLSMMERAGRSVAMGDAPERIKETCTHITKTNADDGVSLAIEAVLKHQR